MLIGPTGVGKKFLAEAIGDYACRKGFTACFTEITVLMEKWLMTKADGTFFEIPRSTHQKRFISHPRHGPKKISPRHDPGVT